MYRLDRSAPELSLETLVGPGGEQYVLALKVSS
jgi:hypothetical protein